MAADVRACREFWADGLGLRTFEIIRRDDGSEDGAWLSSTVQGHELIYVRDYLAGSGRLHHLAFWVDSREDVLRAADLMNDAGVPIEAGPSRHIPIQGLQPLAGPPPALRELLFAQDFAFRGILAASKLSNYHDYGSGRRARGPGRVANPTNPPVGRRQARAAADNPAQGAAALARRCDNPPVERRQARAPIEQPARGTATGARADRTTRQSPRSASVLGRRHAAQSVVKAGA
jgi:catechol 2,3-dioxygenase-like lactoylglutathione lyase family enzyme